MKKLTKILLIAVLFVMSLTVITACDTNASEVIPVESISIIGADNVMKNTQEQYAAVITPTNATQKNIIWEIESGGAVISENGVLISTEIGTVVIKATAGGKSTTKQVAVTDSTQTNKPSEPLKAIFYGFEKIGETTYATKVPNDAEHLNLTQITIINYAWKLTSDIQGRNEIPSKVASPLNIGENTFYVLITYNDDVLLYTLQIRRKPIYEVMFHTNGGNLIDTQYIEEDSLIFEPNTPIKTGYEFVAWDKDITTPIFQNTSFNAKWQPITYNISYNLDGSTNGNNPSNYTIETETIILQNAQKRGYIFDGWYLDPEFSKSIESVPKGNYGNLELYAKFKIEPKALLAPTIEWDDITNTITVINTDNNADNVVVSVNGVQRTMIKNDNVFTLSLFYSDYIGEFITITAYATSSDTEHYTDSILTNYISPFVNRNYTAIKDPSVNWGAESGIFMIYLYSDVVNYTITFDDVIIMENNCFVNNNVVGSLVQMPGVVVPPTGFSRYGYKLTPHSPANGKTLTITFTLKKSVNENAIQQYYFESEIVTFTIP